jgi:hypothetical protein
MNKSKEPNVWNEDTIEEEIVKEAVEPTVVKDPARLIPSVEFDLEGLMTDFPTARDLEKFVYDQTGIILNLKGRSNKLKYQIAMDVLNGGEVNEQYLSLENPYLEKNELIPEEPLKPIPARDPRLPPQSELQHLFHSRMVPHPDYEMRALDAKVTVCFRKYNNGMLSYEIEGPLERHSFGEKLDKYGRSRPEIIKWIDPRTGEQLLRNLDGSFTKQGQRLRTLMESYKVNKNASQWSVWVDKDFSVFQKDSIDNPWSE